MALAKKRDAEPPRGLAHLADRAPIERSRLGVRDCDAVASGFGPRCRWLRRARAGPRVHVQAGTRRAAAAAVPPEAEPAGQASVDTGRRHPRTARFVAGLMSYQMDGTEEDLRALGRRISKLALCVDPECPTRDLQETPT